VNGPAPAPQSPMSPAAMRAAFFQTFPAVCLSIVLGAIDQTIVATALPSIAAGVGVAEGLSWVVIAYLIAATIAAPVHGRLGDVFGRKRMLLVSLALSAAGALVAATAPSFGALVIGRVLQGAGGGGLTTLTMAIIGEAIPPRERGRFQAWIAGSFVLASSVGPVLGGGLTEAFGWRSIFWVQVPACAVAAALAWRLPRRVGLAARSFRFDFGGMLLFAAFVAPALMSLSALRRPSLDVVAEVVGLALVAALALWLLLRWERRVPDPLLPLSMLALPGVWRTNLFTACGHGTTVALLTFLPLYLVAVRGVSPGAAGLLLLPLSLGGGAGGLTGGRLMTAIGVAAPLAAFGLAGSAIGLAAVAFAAPLLTDLGLALLLGLSSFGIGLSYPVSQIVVQVAAGPAQLGAAAASVQYARTLGAAAATALLGVALFGTVAASEPSVAGRFGQLLREGPGLVAVLPVGDANALREALAAGFRAAFLAAALLAAVGCAAAAAVPVRRI